jgi:hypothetical protein
MKETKTPKTAKPKTAKNTKKVSEEVVAVAPEPISVLDVQTVSTPMTLRTRLMPPNLIAELDSILERLTKLENLLLK